MEKKVPSIMSNPQSLRALIIEDSEDDVLIIIRELKKGGYNPVYERVETAAAMKKALQEKQWDIILCDYKMPKFNAPSAIAVLKNANIDIPIVIVSGTIGEDVGIECMRLGAHDYIMKGNLSRLCPAIERELAEEEVRNKQRQAESQREAALEALQESEETLRALINTATDSVILLDTKGVILNLNKIAAERLGKSRDELLGTYAGDALSANIAKMRRSIILPILETGRAIRFEDQRDGTWFDTGAYPITDKDGAVNRVAIIARDITERKKAEEALRESEYKYKSLIENIPGIILTIGLEGTITFVSRRTNEILGYEDSEMINMAIFNFIPEEDHQRAMESLQKGMKGGKIKHFQIPMIAKSGEKVFFESSFTRIYKDGAVVGAQGTAIDITERKQAEDLLRQSEEKYRNILENMQEGYFEVDLAGNLTFFNDSMCQIWGYSKDELMGMNNRQYADKENARKLFQAFNKVYNTGEPTEGFDWQIIRKDGTKKYVEASVSLQKDSSDKPKGFRGIVRDITERKQAETALRESEYKYKSLIENIPDIIFTIDLEGKITFASKKAKEILGYEDSETINMHFFNFIPEEDRQEAVEKMLKGMKGEKIKHIQTSIIAKSGEKLFFDCSFSRIYQDGAVVGAQGTAVDITERKHAESQREAALEALRLSEENFRRSLEDLLLGVRIVTIEGDTIYANQAILDIYGYDSMEELNTTPVENRYTPESFAEYQIRKEKRKRGDDAPSEYDIDILRKDGEVRHLHVFRKDILWNGERQFQVLYSDITDRKQSEKRIHASLREKDILLSEVHHRVKNNMQVISGLLALQASSAGNPELTEKLNESQSRIRSMAMIHEKLYNSKDFTRIDLAVYVRDLSEELLQAYKINPEKIDLIVKTNGDVYLDVSKAIPCGLILNELISNALKHAFPGDRRGELQILINETKDTEIEIVVRDNGLGLPDDVDIHQPRSVGLHLVNGLVRNQFDGQIDVRQDNGTEFRIKFPL